MESTAILAPLGLSHILFGMILISAKKKQKSDYVLLLWLIVLLMPFLQHILVKGDLRVTGLLNFNNQAFSLLNGPFLFLYMKELTRDESKTIVHWPHFLLFAVYYFYLIINPEPLQPGGPADPSPPAAPDPLLRYFGFVSLIYFSIYAFFSLRALHHHRRVIKETYAFQNGEITLLWLSLLPILFVFLLILIVVRETVYVGFLPNPEVLHLIVYLLLALYLIFFGLRQTNVYPGRKTKTTPRPPDEPKQKKNTRSGDTDDPVLLEKLRSVMKKEELYLNPTLSVYDLARATEISRHRISSLLNENLSVNFFHFVNGYRLEEVCRRLREDSEYRHNILEHAFDSGFNSKSSFNSLFKEKYGLTPSQYKKSLAGKDTSTPMAGSKKKKSTGDLA